jgi:hypothetical protein
MSDLLLKVLGMIILLVPAQIARAEPSVRVRGTIERVEEDVYVTRTRDGGELKVKLAGRRQVWAVTKASLADLKPGSYVGAIGVPQPDGSQRALEVHIMNSATRPPGDRQRAWDLQPSSLLTNGTVEQAVASGDGQVLTIKYEHGQQKVVLPPGIPVVTLVEGEKSDLKPGASIFIAAARKEPDGTLVAWRITVGRGIEPPM